MSDQRDVFVAERTDNQQVIKSPLFITNVSNCDVPKIRAEMEARGRKGEIYFSEAYDVFGNLLPTAHKSIHAFSAHCPAYIPGRKFTFEETKTLVHNIILRMRLQRSE